MFDIGGDFIKMIEDTFGPKWSKMLIFIISIGIASACVKITFSLIYDVYHSIINIAGDNSLKDLLQDKMISAIITLVVLVILWELARSVYRKELLEMTKEAKDSLYKSEECMSKAAEYYDMALKEIEKAKEEISDHLN